MNSIGRRLASVLLYTIAVFSFACGLASFKSPAPSTAVARKKANADDKAEIEQKASKLLLITR